MSIKGCLGCDAMESQGLTYEKAHNSTKVGYLETSLGFVPNPHSKKTLEAGMGITNFCPICGKRSQTLYKYRQDGQMWRCITCLQKLRFNKDGEKI